MYTRPEIREANVGSKIKVDTSKVDKKKPQAESPPDIREMLAGMTEEERAKVLAEFTPKKTPKRQQEEEEAREYLFDQLPRLKKIIDSPHVPGGFVVEFGKDRAGNFFANTRNIRKKRK